MQNLRHLTFCVLTQPPGPCEQRVNDGHLQCAPFVQPVACAGLGQVDGRPALGSARFLLMCATSELVGLAWREVVGCRPCFLLLRLPAKQALQNLRHFTFCVLTQPPGPWVQYGGKAAHVPHGSNNTMQSAHVHTQRQTATREGSQNVGDLLETRRHGYVPGHLQCGPFVHPSA